MTRKNKVKLTFLLLSFVLLCACINSGVDSSEIPIKDETFVVKSNSISYVGGNEQTRQYEIRRHYIVSSDVPLDIYVVPSESEYKLMTNKLEFNHYSSCKAIDTLKYDRTCTISSKGGIIFINENEKDATVSLKISDLD